MKIKIFEGDNITKLERDINHFISGLSIIDIFVSTIGSNYLFLITYD